MSARTSRPSTPGFRLFEVDEDLERTGLSMYWNDSEVQTDAVLMDNGEYGLESPGSSGLASGDYDTDTTDANDNARAWGEFDDSGKGNDAYLDTYTWIDSTTSGTFTVSLLDDTTSGTSASPYCTMLAYTASLHY